MNDSTLYGIRVRSFIFPIKPFLYQNSPKNEKFEQFSTFKSNERPKNNAKKMFWCYHLIIKYQKDIKKSQAITIKEYGQRGFVTPSDHCALVTRPPVLKIRSHVLFFRHSLALYDFNHHLFG